MKYFICFLSTWFSMNFLDKPVKCDGIWKFFKSWDGTIIAKFTKNGAEQVDVLKRSDILDYFRVDKTTLEKLSTSLDIIGNNSTQVDVRIGSRMSHSGYAFLAKDLALTLQSTSNYSVILENGTVVYHDDCFICLDPRVRPTRQYQFVLEAEGGYDVRITPWSNFKENTANNYIYNNNLRLLMQFEIYKQLYGDRSSHLHQDDSGLNRHSNDEVYTLCQKYIDKGYINQKVYSEELIYYKYLKKSGLVAQLENLMTVNSLFTDNSQIHITGGVIKESGGHEITYSVGGDMRKNEADAYKSWLMLNNFDEW